MKFRFPVLIVLLLGILSACGGEAEEKKPIQTDPLADHPGKAYYDKYCGLCHALPDPTELDKTTWRDYILVRMGAYMGIYFDNTQYYDSVPSKWLEPGEGGERILAEGIYPQKPLLKREEFEQIRDYVLKAAPEQTFGPPSAVAVPMDLEGFRVKTVRLDTLQPFVSALHIDEEASQLYAGLLLQPLVKLDPSGKILDSLSGWTMPVQIHHNHQGLEVVDIGSFGGSDSPQGSYRRGKSLRALRRQKEMEKFERLMRPVEARYADLDQDRDEDLVIAEFGYHLGRLVWHEKEGSEWMEHVLFEDDGTVAFEVLDLTGDGASDILALQANSDEKLVVYENDGQGGFKARMIERFSPAAGSAAMELADLNEDGRPEVIICQGDNGDYPPILKHWHGVRIFQLTPALDLKEVAYLPMNGAYGTKTRDFDQDGDLDIAAVAFYPNYQNRPEESFIYFENTSGTDLEALTFTPHTIPQVNLSRWMVLDAGDLDGDGDEDIVLGGFNVRSSDASEEQYQRWMANNIPIMILENRFKLGAHDS